MLENFKVKELKRDLARKIDMKKIRRYSNDALNEVKGLGRRRVHVAGRAVSPLVIGGVAVVLIAGLYLLLRSKNNTEQYAGTDLQGQAHS